jgi:hypothetical protein
MTACMREYDYTKTRGYTDMALELVEESYILPEDLIHMCLKYMSDTEVKDMLHYNQVCHCFYEDEEE